MRISIALVLLSLGCGGSTVEVEEPSAPRAEVAPAVDAPLGDRLAPDVRPTRYQLSLAIDPRQDSFSGVAEIDVALPRPARRIVLHGQGLEVGEARAVAGSRTVSARWRVLDAERGVAAVELDDEIGPGQVTLRIAYSAPFDHTLEGIYRVQVQDDWYAFSQMEPLAARKAFPCFDEPAFKAPFDVTLAIPSGMRAIGNGPEAESVTEGERLRVRFERTPPLPSYLVAFAVGPLDIVEATSIAPNDVRARPLPLRGVATRGQGPRLAHALRHTPTIVAALERWFGIEYPYAKLDLIAVPDFGAGAMENAGAITFRERLLLLGEDPPIAQQRAFAFVTAHELAHHWFGNLVTTAWWDDLWLNEAFATWMETHALEQDFPELRAEIAEVEVFAGAIGADSLATARRIREPIASDHDVHNAFDDITYGKGASILAMFEAYLGEDVFRRGVQSYLRSHEHGTAAAGDLLAALDQASGRDVSTPFATFLDQSGTPFVRVEVSCEESRPRLALAQSRYLPLGSHAEAERVWQVPVCVRYQLGGQSGGELRRACTLLDRPQGELALEGCPDWVMPNADGIGYYVWSLPAPQLEALRTRGMARLSAREQLAVAQNVRQAERAGGIAYADALALLVPLASSTERELATSAMGLLERGIDRLVDASERDRARAAAGRVYAGQLRRLGWAPRRGATEDQATRGLRADVLGFLAGVARDPAVRREAGRRGRAYLGLGGDRRLHPSAVPTDLANMVVAVAIQDGGAEAFDHALALFAATTEAEPRATLLAGLSAVRDPALRGRALDLALDERLRVSEAFRPMMAQSDDAEGIEGVWAWLREHYDALATRIGPGMAGYLPFAAMGLCAADRIEEVSAFFQPRVGATQGGPRNLASTLESVELCAAHVAAQRESARAYFSR